MEITTIKDAIHKYLSDKGYNKIDLRTAMFDMDGVLFDSMKNHAYSWHETMKHFGMLLPYEEAYMNRTNNPEIKKVINACSSMNAKEVYFIIFKI